MTKTHVTETIITKIIRLGIFMLIFLLPLYFLPITQDSFEFNKQFLFIILVLFIFSLWGIKSFIDKKILIRKSKLDAPLFLLMIVFFLAMIFSKNRYISLMGTPGNLHWNFVEFISFYLFYYLVSSNLDTKDHVFTAIKVFIGSVFVSSFIYLLSFLNILQIQTNNSAFNTMGSANNLLLLGVVALLLLGMFFKKIFTGTKAIYGKKKMFFSGFLSFIVFITIFCATITVLPFANGILKNYFPNIYTREASLNFKASWNVSMDSLKNNPLLGTGFSTFTFNYNRYKPVEMNYTEYWNSSFAKPISEYFLLLTETGMLGLFAFIFFIFKVGQLFIKVQDKQEIKPYTLLLTIALFLFFTFIFIPTSILITFTLFLLLSLSVVLIEKSDISNKQVKVADIATFVNNRNVLPGLFTILALGITIFITYEAGRFLIAEYYFKKAQQSILQNNGAQTYEFLQKTIAYNPYRDTYRNVYGQTSLLLAQRLSQKAQDQTKLSDEEINSIQQLLQQSIREIRISTETLVPQSAMNWELRGKIYKELVSVTQEASNWMVESYTRAISLDPNNPRLYIELGGIYYQLKDYETAISYFKNAALLKNDYANAYYNLSAAYKENSEYDLAYASLEKVSKLLNEDDPDYEKVTTQLTELKKLVPENQTTPSAK